MALLLHDSVRLERLSSSCSKFGQTMVHLSGRGGILWDGNFDTFSYGFGGMIYVFFQNVTGYYVIVEFW